MNNLSVLGKYLDQPKLVKTFSQAVPGILVAGGSIYGLNHIKRTPENQRRKETVKTISVLTATIISALAAPKITSKIIKNDCHHHHHDAKELIEHFLKENKVSKQVEGILTKAKEKVLKFSEVKKVFEEFENNPKGKTLLKELIPEPHDIDSNHIFKEDIPRLSVLGLFPVLGGITGGIIGDKLTEDNWKERIPNKIKEGSYQYLANIFLCNVGAGLALLGIEKSNLKFKIKSNTTYKMIRAAGMVGGIVLTGLIFGSAIANLFGKKVVDPLLGNRHAKNESIYSERKPEAIDMGLHVDDIATVAVLSGLKWIEPALPILYSISGYRAGIGYRNNNK